MTRELNYKTSLSFSLLIKPESMSENDISVAVEKNLKHKYPRLISICKSGAIDLKEYNAHCVPELAVSTDIYDSYDPFPTYDSLLRRVPAYKTGCTVSLAITTVQDDDWFIPVLTRFGQIKLFKQIFAPYFDNISEDKFKSDFINDFH